MRLLTIGAAGLALAACGPTPIATRPTSPPPPPPTSVIAEPPAETASDEEMLGRAATIRTALIPGLFAKNCRSAGGYSPCRNLAIPCALQETVSASDQASGVAYRLVFVTGFEAQSPQTQRWQAAGEFIKVEITTDGAWHSSGVAERNGASCAGETDTLTTRRLRFSP